MKISKGQHANDSCIQSIMNEYGKGYDSLKWISAPDAQDADEKRQSLIGAISDLGSFVGASGTKLDMNRLAPGCRICVEGRWSCLFINGQCNGRCFYCPAPQEEVGIPVTNTISFDSADDYAAYVQALRFKGVSISGGEPFLTFEKSLLYIKTVKESLGDSIHTWLYTNGTRATRDKLNALRDAGLDEIRFDIGATGYNLKKVAMAAGVIPTVTVEIPAVPEELNRIKSILPQMSDAGISFLNLHQLRLTPHNFPHISNRGYTFLHGEKATVLESELAALEIVRYALATKINIGINYCSFVYKNRYQRAAARQRAAEEISKPFETITLNGYIRSLSLNGSQEKLADICKSLKHRPEISDSDWSLESGGKQLFLSPELLNKTATSGLTITVAYSEAMLLPAISYFNPFREIRLKTGKKIFVERQKRLPVTPIPEELRNNSIFDILNSWERSRIFEQIPEGLSDYY